MSRFNFCDCPAGFSAAPERHAPDCPGRSGAGKRSPTPVPATLKPAGEPKPYPDRLCHIDYTAHPHRCGCLSGDDEAQRRFDGCKRDTKLATAEGELARLTAERDALQLRLNAADQRIDDFAGGECEWHREDDSGIWNSGCGETWSFHEDGPEENGMHFCHSCGKHLVVEVAEQEQDDDWHMNPCKQGHRDVGASGGVAACNQCDEKIEASTTQEAFERWNATHPQQ